MLRHLVTATLAGLLVPAVLSAAPAATAQQPTSAGSLRAQGQGDGVWSVTRAGTDTWRVSWTSPERLPVGGDRPMIVAPDRADLTVGVPITREDGRTVSATVVAAESLDPADLDVMLSGVALDEPETSRRSAGGAPWTAPDRQELATDPGVAGDLPTESSDYALPDLELRGFPAPVQMVGHVVRPAPSVAEDDDPLVLFLHGKHPYCYQPSTGALVYEWPCPGTSEPLPSHLGYDYVQELLASQGYVTVSIAANGIDAQDGELPDGGAAARARLVREHLDHWAELDDEGDPVDLDQVVLVGHSRGGEGVARTSLQTPLDAPYRIAGQVLLAPTDFARQTTPYVPTVTVLPSCDGDIFDLMGQSYTDRSRDLVGDDTSMKSSVLVIGANHNYFNTEWTPGISVAESTDDWYGDEAGPCGPSSETRLSAAEQRDVGKAYVAGAVRLFVGSEDDLLPLYDGSLTSLASTGDAVVLSHMLGGGRVLRRPGIDAEPSDGSAATGLCVGSTPPDGAAGTCGRFAQVPVATPHWPAAEEQLPRTSAFQMRWSSPGQDGGLSFDEPLDLSDAGSLDLRTVVDPRLGDVQVQVRVTDTSGADTVVSPVGGDTLAALPSGAGEPVGRYWAQTLRVDPSELSGLDLAHISEVELVGTSADGRVWVLDVAAAPTTLPAVPAKRIALVDLGRVRVDEGGPGPHVAEVPFRVVGTLPEPGQLRVFGSAYRDLPDGGLTVDVPAGATGGTIAWEHVGNDRDSEYLVRGLLTGHALSNLMVRDNHGEVVITDDDPSPRMTFKADDVVQEGDTATWTVRLKEPFKAGMQIGLVPVGVDGTRPARVDDLAKRWLESAVFWEPGTNPPLDKTKIALSVRVSTARPVGTFSIPVRDDDRVERREAITLRAVSDTGWRSRPVTVTIAAGR